MAGSVDLSATNDTKEEDLERKMRKEQKAKEKEMKKLKAAQKVEAAKAAQNSKASQPSKKKELKAAKDAAVVEGAEADYVHPPTMPGEKKKLAPEMAKTYNPRAVETAWYEWWEKAGFFVADPDSHEPSFVIVVPPPNVTGALHIGHALTAAIEDTVVRWRRMQGYNTLWVPGVDHAGIATQVVVEKKLMREKRLTRHDVGREKFLEEVWKWKEEYGGTICKQQRRIGGSLDWSRECFTMDAKRSRAVIEAFVCLHTEGLIYRDNRPVNWDCALRTAISDIEVEYIDIEGLTPVKVPGYESPIEFGLLTSFAYPLEGELGEIVVSTTRPETMLGDTAVAVHPEDERYKYLHGKCVIHPFNGRILPIVCDAVLVDPTFGTGAVKITPAHDPNDFEVGKRHNLEFINIFTDDGKINSNGGRDFEGLKRFDARTAVTNCLKDKGLYRGVENNNMQLKICSRSADVVEPMLKPQWFVNCKEMARASCEAVRCGHLEILPKQYEADWFRWLENIHDWCISRQLWWGHRVPAWYVMLEDDERTVFGADVDRWVVGRSKEDAELQASRKYPGKKFKLEQDPDVLDTWFSSGLFPFSVMGWPDSTSDFKSFYPTSLLETGHDILFFWVARMVMLGIKLTGHVPFKKVYLHAMIRDGHGRKMSKSRGNVIDPLDVIYGISLDGLLKRLEQASLDKRELEIATSGLMKDFPEGIPECGADALRFALLAYASQSDKINLDILRVIGYRHWCNKLWNAVRFGMMNLGKGFVPSQEFNVGSLPFGCKWILSVLNKTIVKTTAALEAYNFSGATTAVYSWWLYQFCDVFIEIIKPTMVGDGSEPNGTALRRATMDTLFVCLENGLRLLHPFMPFVTEELWQQLPEKPGHCSRTASIMIARYPCVIKEWDDAEAEVHMVLIESIVKSIRSLRMSFQLQTKQRLEAFLLCKTEEASLVIKKGYAEIAALATLSIVKILRETDKPPEGCAVAVVNEHISTYLHLQGVVDATVEISNLRKRKEELFRQHEALAKNIDAPGYKEKIPSHVQEENLNKSRKLLAELETVEEARRNYEMLLIHDN